MGGEHQSYRLHIGECVQRPADRVRVRADVPGVVVVVADLVKLGRARAHRLAGGLEVVQILAARRVRAERASHERERPSYTGVTHLRQRVGQVGRPVSVAPVERQVYAGAGHFLP